MTQTNAPDATPLTGSIGGRPIRGTPAHGSEPATGVEALALHWFATMRSGQIDRSQLAPEYSAHLTDEAVLGMSRYIKAYEFGHLPLHAHVLKTRVSGDQTFHVVKLVFPRGDAASLLFGLDTQGKITGISLMSMAGD
ncbi:MAG TPA: hypothetical protein VGM32_12365 [Rhodopila sp.]|jgi:hypothetical protein